MSEKVYLLQSTVSSLWESPSVPICDYTFEQFALVTHEGIMHRP